MFTFNSSDQMPLIGAFYLDADQILDKIQYLEEEEVLLNGRTFDPSFIQINERLADKRWEMR